MNFEENIISSCVAMSYVDDSFGILVLLRSLRIGEWLSMSLFSFLYIVFFFQIIMSVTPIHALGINAV